MIDLRCAVGVLLSGLFVLGALAACTTGGEDPATWSGPPGASESTTTPSAAAAPPPTPSTPPTSYGAPGQFGYVFPVKGNASYAREHHDYPASDIMAPCGAQVLAVINGVVLEVNRVDRWDEATDDGAWRGGRFLSILGDDGVRYYGAHFESIEESLSPGTRVTAGQTVGQVGRTGRAGACHLHFAISPPCAQVGDWAIRRGVVWPWRYLDSWRSGGQDSAVTEVASWQASHDCG